jgi:hypothetical protein
MKAKESQLRRPEKEVIPNSDINKKADWLVASAVDNIYNLEDSG